MSQDHTSLGTHDRLRVVAALSLARNIVPEHSALVQSRRGARSAKRATWRSARSVASRARAGAGRDCRCPVHRARDPVGLFA